MVVGIKENGVTNPGKNMEKDPICGMKVES